MGNFAPPARQPATPSAAPQGYFANFSTPTSSSLAKPIGSSTPGGSFNASFDMCDFVATPTQQTSPAPVQGAQSCSGAARAQNQKIETFGNSEVNLMDFM